MTDEELRQCIHQAVDHKLSGVRTDNQLARRVLHASKGEKPMKRRLTLLPAMVLIIALLTMAAAAAEALGIHVFELFGKTDERYARLAPQATLEQTVTFEGSGKMPESLALYVLEFHEDPWHLEDVLKDTVPIRLTITEVE